VKGLRSSEAKSVCGRGTLVADSQQWVVTGILTGVYRESPLPDPFRYACITEGAHQIELDGEKCAQGYFAGLLI
jgi:hypothetical protein